MSISTKKRPQRKRRSPDEPRPPPYVPPRPVGTVIPMGAPLYLVQGHGGEYINNAETGFCYCPHARFRLWARGQRCKHAAYLLRWLERKENDRA